MPNPKPHGIKHYVPSNQISNTVLAQIESCLLGIKEDEGEVIATRTYKTKLTDGKIVRYLEVEKIVYLLSHLFYNCIYNLYPESIGLTDYVQELAVSFSRFYLIWKRSESLRFMKIGKASKNLCDECTMLRNQRRGTVNLEVTGIGNVEANRLPEVDVFELSEQEQQLQLHQQDYQPSRTAYEADIPEAKQVDSETCTFSFDFQEVVEIPRVLQQPSQWYYWLPFKLYVFGIVDDSIDQYYHAMDTEAQQGKGANQVVSILHSFLTAIPNLRFNIDLWADNCGGQNKNKTILWYLCWLTAIPNIKEVILGFQIKGHTRNSGDRRFGTVKQKADTNAVWTPEMYAQLVDTTDKEGNIKAVRLFNHPAETIFRDWASALEANLKPLKGIQSNHFFWFTTLDQGIVEVKRQPRDEWIKVDLRKRDFLLSKFLNIEPSGLQDTSLNPEKGHDLWNKY